MKYIKPEFDVTVYEVEDVITASSPNVGFGPEDPNPGTDDDTNWFG